MERFVRGDVVVVHFPFSDLSGSKKRPVLVLKPLKGNDVIVCQITSKDNKDTYSIALDDKNDMFSGSLNKNSNIRPNKIFTADRKIIEKKVGTVKERVIKSVIDKITYILSK
jgi:mRNA interferase MazF